MYSLLLVVTVFLAAVMLFLRRGRVTEDDLFDLSKVSYVLKLVHGSSRPSATADITVLSHNIAIEISKESSCKDEGLVVSIKAGKPTQLLTEKKVAECVGNDRSIEIVAPETLIDIEGKGGQILLKFSHDSVHEAEQTILCIFEDLLQIPIRQKILIQYNDVDIF